MLERCSVVMTWCQTSPCSYHSRLAGAHQSRAQQDGQLAGAEGQALEEGQLLDFAAVGDEEGVGGGHAGGAAEGGGFRFVDAGPPAVEVVFGDEAVEAVSDVGRGLELGASVEA